MKWLLITRAFVTSNGIHIKKMSKLEYVVKKQYSRSLQMDVHNKTTYFLTASTCETMILPVRKYLGIT